MSFKERVSEGEDFVIEHVSRKFGSRPTEVFKIDGITGVVTIHGVQIGGEAFTYHLMNCQAGDSTGGPISLSVPRAEVGDIVSEWLRLDASGAGGKGSLSDRDAGGEHFETMISSNGQILQLEGIDLTPFNFILLLKRAV